MKKNVMMRMASFLLVAVLISTSAISGTYAKYVTTNKSDDNARVAKFGVTIKADFEELFATTYGTTKAWDGDDGNSVVSSEANVDVVAPGTNGKLADFDISGTPEVDVNVSYTANLDLGDNWMVDTDDDKVADSEYCPIVITVKTKAEEAKDYFIGGTDRNGDDITSVTELEQAVEEAIVASEKNYNAPNSDLNLIKDDLEVSWKWHFEGQGEFPGVGTGPACQWDKFDTQLGDAAANNNAATIYLEVSCTVTQID